MSSEKSRKPSVDTTLVLKTSGPLHHPFERLRRFKRVKRYLKTYDGSRFAMLEITENDYKTLCRDSSRITLTESDELPRNDRHVKIFLRKNDTEKEESDAAASAADGGNEKDVVDKNGNNQKQHLSLFSSEKLNTLKRHPSFPAPSTPRPQMRQKTFGIVEIDD